MAQQIVLASRPQGIPAPEHFEFQSLQLPPLQEGEVQLKGLYYSVDPYMRGRMNDTRSYAPPYQVGKPITGGVVARVTASRHEQFREGELLTGMLPWATEMVVPAKGLQKVQSKGVPAHYYLGILGMPGLTAYFGLMDIGRPKAGETVVVSGAAGAVGLLVGQIAKIQGCRVVGIAGSDEKIQMLQQEFAYDTGINYKTAADLRAAVAAACPQGVDIYFDNVGGEVSDAVIYNLNFHARIALCGQIALYNAERTPMGPRLQPILLTRSVLMKGYIVRDYQERFSEGMQQLTTWVKEGKLKYTETIIKGFEHLPDAFLGLFFGKNQGKMIVAAED